MAPLVENMADSRQVRDGRKKHRTQRRQWQADLRELMQVPAFQRVAREILTWGHPYGSSFDPDAAVMAFKEGERNVALRLFGELERASPVQFYEQILLPGAQERAQQTRDAEHATDGESRDDQAGAGAGAD